MSTHTTNAIVQTAKLVTLGDAIRAKAGLSDEMTLDEMATAVANIETGGTYQSKSVTPSTSSQTVTPDSGYDALSSVTVSAMPSGSASTPATTITATPTISVSSSGLITASVSKTQSVTPSVSAGYVASGTSGTITVSGSDTSQLTTQSAQTITPTTTNQTIASGKYLTGTQTIKGDANLLAENIAEGVSIFGITGTHSGGGGGLQVYSSTDYSDGIFTLPQGVSDADLQSNVKAITATNIQIYFKESDLYTPSSIGCTMDYSRGFFFISGLALDNYLFYLGFTYSAESGFLLNDLLCFSFADADFVDVAITSVGSFDFIK